MFQPRAVCGLLSRGPGERQGDGPRSCAFGSRQVRIWVGILVNTGVMFSTVNLKKAAIQGGHSIG